MWFCFSPIIFFFIVFYLFNYESYVVRDAWFPYLWFENWDGKSYFYYYGLQYGSQEQFRDNEYSSFEIYFIHSWFVENFEFFFIIFYIIFFILFFFKNRSDGSYVYLWILKGTFILKQGKIGLLLCYKWAINFMYAIYVLIFNNLKVLFFILIRFNNFFIFWRPIFRKISYYGVFHSSQSKWFLKNFNKK